MKAIILWFGFTLVYAYSSAQGLIFDKEAFDKGEKYEAERSDFIPTSFSLKKYAPYVFAQKLSTCVAYSSASAITMMNAILQRETDIKNISLQVASPHWIYYRNKDKTDTGCKEGLNIEKAMSDILNNGVPNMLFVEFPDYYPFGDVHLCNYYPPDYEKDAALASLNKPDEIFRISNPEDIKAIISKGLPVVIGMVVPSSFETSIGKDVWTPLSKETILDGYGHAIVVVGYDDKKYGGSFEVLNSWGESWGNQGYIWVKYTDFNRFFLGGYAFYKEKKLGIKSTIISEQENSLLIEKDIKLSNKNRNIKSKRGNRWENLGN